MSTTHNSTDRIARAVRAARTDRAARANRVEPADRIARAVRAARRELPGLSGFATALAGEPTQVVLTSGTPCTDGDRVYVRPLPEMGDVLDHERGLCGKRDEDSIQRCDACRVHETWLIIMYHEISHKRSKSFAAITDHDRSEIVTRTLAEYGSADDSTRAAKLRARLDAKAPKSYIEAASIVSPYLPMLLNSLEDARVNAEMYRARPGTKAMFRALNIETFKKGVERPDGTFGLWSEMPKNAQAVIATYAVASGLNITGYFDSDVEVAFADADLIDLLSRVESSPDVGAVYRIAFPILEKLRGHGFCKVNTDPEDDPAPQPATPEPTPEQSEEQESGGEESGMPDDATPPGGQAGDDPGEPSADENGMVNGGDPAGVPEDDAEQKTPTRHEDFANEDPTDESDDDSDDDAGTPADDDAGTPADDDAGTPTDDDSADDDSDDDAGTPADDDAGTPADDDAGTPADDDAGTPADDDSADDDAGTPADDDSADDSDQYDDPNLDYEDLYDDQDENDGDDEGVGDRATGTGDGFDETFVGDEDPQYDDSMGDPDAIKDLLDKFTGHDEMPQGAGNGDGTYDRDSSEQIDPEIERALNQTEHFDAPSLLVGGLYISKSYDDIEPGHKYGFADEAMKIDHRYIDRWALDLGLPPESILAPALQNLRVVFADNKRAKQTRNLKSGSVDARVLARRVPVQDPRLFQKTRVPGKRDYFVVIGLDISSSTSSNGKIRTLKAAAMAQAELLSRLGVSFAVYGHTGRYRSGMGLCVEIAQVKDERQPWDANAKQRLADLIPGGGNCDGHVFEYFRKVAERTSATNKVILFHTDGEMHDCEDVLLREINYARVHNIDIVGIGIQTDSPVQWGLDTIVMNDIQDLPKVVRELKSRLSLP